LDLLTGHQKFIFLTNKIFCLKARYRNVAHHISSCKPLLSLHQGLYNTLAAFKYNSVNYLRTTLGADLFYESTTDHSSDPWTVDSKGRISEDFLLFLKICLIPPPILFLLPFSLFFFSFSLPSSLFFSCFKSLLFSSLFCLALMVSCYILIFFACS
jgi:hypothetical protein